MHSEPDVSRETQVGHALDVVAARLGALPSDVSRETTPGAGARLCSVEGCGSPTRSGGRYCGPCHAAQARASRARHKRPVSPINARAAAHILLLLLCAGEEKRWITRPNLFRSTHLTRSTFYRRLGDLQVAGFPVQTFVDGPVAYMVDPAAVPSGTALRIAGALVADFGLCVAPIDPDLIRLTQTPEATAGLGYLELCRYLEQVGALDHRPRARRNPDGRKR